MAKENKEEKIPNVKIASNGSLEKSENDKHSVVEEEEEQDEEEKSRRKLKLRRQHKVISESEYDDQDDKAASETGESVAIPIEDDAADAPDGKVTQKQANTYAAKKTVAQGMMDIALITANANQLRYLIEFNRNSSTFYINVFLIVLSLLLQLGVGLSLIFKGGLDLKGQSKHRYAKRINNYVVVGVFLVTIINVFVASFTVTGTGATYNQGGSMGGNGVNLVAAGLKEAAAGTLVGLINFLRNIWWRRRMCTWLLYKHLF